jgi:lysozyme family protein
METEKETLSLEERKFLFEKENAEQKAELQKLELEIKKLEIETKMQADRKTFRGISPVTATIAVAVISFAGSALGTFIQGKNTNELEREKFEYNSRQERSRFQSTLITKALEGQSQDDRVNFLNFLTSINLIDDTALARRITLFVKTTPDKIPFISTPTSGTVSMPRPFQEEITKGNNDLFVSCIIRPGRMAEANRMVDRMVANKARYDTVSAKTGVPWQAIAIVHMMEAALNFTSHLHNGDPLTARTVQFPKGRPLLGNPPFTWEESAVDAINFGLGRYKDWSTKGFLTAFEAYNGMGYRTQNINSPYLWSGTNHYTSGRYVADGTFDPKAVYSAIGIAVYLKVMEQKGVYKYVE